jgi:capsular polysaccharide export protein
MNPQLESAGALFCHGFSWRKKRLLEEFIHPRTVLQVKRGALVPEGSLLFVWGNRESPNDLPASVRVVRVEDGFIRSAGLGADLVRPVSWVFDEAGIYFDPRRPSDLERTLQQAGFSAEELARAAQLRRCIVEAGITKYNLTGAAWSRPAKQQVVLVAGQVEADASILAGCIDVRTNLELLRAVRKERPGAWIVYKPHPDVVAGLRAAGAGEPSAHQICDEIVLDASMDDLLRKVDEVHVMTSSTGFEALLRQRTVFCWGQPFYAGWGLTEDAHRHPRRTRKLELDELVAGALLRYPVYLNSSTRQRCTAEAAVRELMMLRAKSSASLPWWRSLLRPLLART